MEASRQGAAFGPREMDHLIDVHLRAEMDGDSARAVSVYTEDVEHDVVGAPHGPLHGRTEARGFYDRLIEAIRTETIVATRRYYGEDFCVQEHQWTGTVPGTLLGVAGRGKRISFRMLHVWEFRDGKISRENVWLDGGSIVAQCNEAPDATPTTLYGEIHDRDARHDA